MKTRIKNMGMKLTQLALLSPTNWTPAAGTNLNDGTNDFMTITAPAQSLFFRLSHGLSPQPPPPTGGGTGPGNDGPRQEPTGEQTVSEEARRPGSN
jgi:hypothetical protein